MIPTPQRATSTWMMRTLRTLSTSLAFDGIRHAGIVDNTGNKADMNGAITYAALLKALRA